MLPNPDTIDKYLYVNRTPTWLVRSFYIFGLLAWTLIVVGFLPALAVDPFFRWFVGPIILLFTIYHVLSFGINILYKRFDLKKHENLIQTYWSENDEPSVDIFLPICGEDIEILENTWNHVAKIDYTRKTTYVLDDSKLNAKKHKLLAESLGFVYVERPNKGEMKKAGNLKYSYERTDGDFITIFDADFAPRTDFLKELLPYTSDPTVGIVQSPQYFIATKALKKKFPLAYAAAYQEELFYRVIQVAKDRLRGAICCGSNAIYRRSALKAIGGPRQVDASEDSRTGYAMLIQGYITRYVPLLLAIGVCPDSVYAYYHQQHRWCRGRSQLILSKEFITSDVPFLIKLCNISSFISFAIRPLEVILSFQLFWTLFFYNAYISAANDFIFIPYMIFSFILLPSFHILRFSRKVFFASIIRTYASTHALFSVIFGRTVSWIPTNARHTTISKAFKQTMSVVSIYLFAVITLLAIAVRENLIHIFNYNYYSVEFWIFWNIFFSSLLLWEMYREAETAQRYAFDKDSLRSTKMLTWQVRTVLLYVFSLTGAFFLILYI